MNLQKLGIGTIWMGRHWPMNDKNYVSPSVREVNQYLEQAVQHGARHFDTAAAYGLAEARLGDFLKEHPELLQDPATVITTKCGEQWSPENGSTIDNSLEGLTASFDNSLTLLPRIDVLYFHKPTLEVLTDPSIRARFEAWQDEGLIKHTGVSVSNPDLLKILWAANALWPSYLQVASRIVFQHSVLLEVIASTGKVIVVNAPVRGRPAGMSIAEAYQNLTSQPFINTVLTGSRHHLRETVGYFLEAE
jgi:aryl-alcohol dehydrogenase-like predicted oxidoreductase